MELHEIARMVRKDKGLTQREFANMIMWGFSTYQAFEQNKIINDKYPNPPKDKLEQLALGLGGKLTIVF